MSATRMNDKTHKSHLSNETGESSVFWTFLKYSALVYFNILILPFFIVRVLAKTILFLLDLPFAICKEIQPSPTQSPIISRKSSHTNIPGLDFDSDGSCTPRSSSEWESDQEWEDHSVPTRINALRKPRRNLCVIDYENCRLWEDDDGYNYSSVNVRRSSSMMFDSIIEEE